MLGLAMFPPRGLMLSALSPSGLGSRWLSWANSTSGNEFRPVCALAAGKVAMPMNARKIDRRARSLS